VTVDPLALVMGLDRPGSGGLLDLGVDLGGRTGGRSLAFIIMLGGVRLGVELGGGEGLGWAVMVPMLLGGLGGGRMVGGSGGGREPELEERGRRRAVACDEPLKNEFSLFLDDLKGCGSRSERVVRRSCFGVSCSDSGGSSSNLDLATSLTRGCARRKLGPATLGRA